MLRPLFSAPDVAVEPNWSRKAPPQADTAADRSATRLPVLLPLVLPLLAVGCFTVACRFSDLDIAISSTFYSGLSGNMARRWPQLHAEPWVSMYRFGTLPALTLGIGGLLLATVGYWTGRWATWGRTGLFLALMLALGPGLLVNGLLKPYWNRPRPSQIHEFGGPYEYVRVLSTVRRAHTRSFPSGHASMGFYLMAPAFVFYRRRRLTACTFVLVGLLAGSLLGWGRIAQGGHFLSDVIWSAAAVYLSGLLLCYAFGFHRRLDATWPQPVAAARG